MYQRRGILNASVWPSAPVKAFEVQAFGESLERQREGKITSAIFAAPTIVGPFERNTL